MISERNLHWCSKEALLEQVHVKSNLRVLKVGWLSKMLESPNFKRHPSVEAKDFNNRLFSLFQGNVHSKVQALAQNLLTDFPKQSAVFVCL